MTIKEILKREEYEHISRFSREDIDWINSRIKVRIDGKLGVECIVRGKNSDGDFFELTPEEIIRQHYARMLLEKYNYEKEQLALEPYVYYAGREYVRQKRVDIVRL